MAVVEEYVIESGPARGAHVRILDDAYRDCTPEELQRRADAVNRLCRQLLIKEFERRKAEGRSMNGSAV